LGLEVLVRAISLRLELRWFTPLDTSLCRAFFKHEYSILGAYIVMKYAFHRDQKAAQLAKHYHLEWKVAGSIYITFGVLICYHIYMHGGLGLCVIFIQPIKTLDMYE
jgi:hypothetical protein